SSSKTRSSVSIILPYSYTYLFFFFNYPATTYIYTLSLHDALPIFFLTLTVRNVYDGTELNKSLSDMSKGFNRMMKYKKINKNLVGFMRATEVTVNNIDNSYNQHMHVLVCVESTYFYNTENY